MTATTLKFLKKILCLVHSGKGPEKLTHANQRRPTRSKRRRIHVKADLERGREDDEEED